MLLRLASLLGLLSALAPLLSAQVDPSGPWRTLTTEHFRVHYRTGTDAMARHAAAEAERAWVLLSRELVTPRQDIDLVLSDAADFSNGFANVFPSNRITLLLTPPPSEPDLQNYDDWVRVVLIHELVHVFHLDRVRGPWRLLQSLLGRVPGAFPNLYQPSWVTEGLATWYESHLTGRGRIRGSLHTEVLLPIAASGWWPRPNRTTYITERWPDGVAPYAFGSRFFQHLSQAAGDSAVPRFIERTSGQWVPFRTGRPLRLATGLRRDSLWGEMAAEYRDYAAGRPAGEVEVIARGMRLQPSPAVAEDGSLAWFEATEDNSARIVIRRPDGRTERHLTTGGLDLAWSGDTLYLARLELADPVTYRSDLYRIADGEWQQLTSRARFTDIAEGPGGLVAVQLVEEGNRLVRYENGNTIPLLEARPDRSVTAPAFSPGGRLAYVRHHDGEYQLVVSHDTTRIAVTARGFVLADPSWLSEDSLLFISDRSGLPQVYLWTNDGEIERVSNERFGARQPTVHGGWLYFSALEADGWSVQRRPWPAGAVEQDMEPQPVAPVPAEIVAVPPMEESGYRPWPALRPHYFIPYVVDKGNAGYFAGAFTSGADPVGRTSYALRMAAGFERGAIDASMYLVHRRWRHHSFDLYLGQDHGDAGVIPVAPVPVPVESRERDAELGFNTTWRRWYRSLTVRLAVDYEEDHFRAPGFQFVNPEFAAGSVGMALGRTLRPPLAISDEDGAVLSLRYRRRWRLDRDGGSDEWRGRLAGYLAFKGLGGFAHPVLATRVSAATSSGQDRETFGVGGASGITYEPLPGIVAGSGRAFPVRGFEAGELRGGTVLVATAEFRVPLALVAEPFWDLPYGLDRLSLRVFYDYGRAWESPVANRPGWIHGAGVEVTWDLLVLYDVPLRVRTGVAAALNDGSTTRQGDLRLGLGFGSEF